MSTDCGEKAIDSGAGGLLMQAHELYWLIDLGHLRPMDLLYFAVLS